MKKNLIIESEVSQILSMHKSLKEQDEKKNTLDTTSDLVKLRKAITAGCLKEGRILTNPDQTKYVYRATSESGKTVDFTADMNYKFTDGSKSGKWKCDEIGKIEQKKSTSLNDNQRKVLEDLGKHGWFYTPKPTDVDVDMGLYTKLSLSDNENGLGRVYSKYFIDDYPKGENDFFIYLKKPEKVETSAESCKTSIERLYNHMKSPNTYPLTNHEKNNYVSTAKRCAEPANKQLFLLRFGLDKKLESIARKYGIKLKK